MSLLFYITITIFLISDENFPFSFHSEEDDYNLESLTVKERIKVFTFPVLTF